MAAHSRSFPPIPFDGFTPSERAALESDINYFEGRAKHYGIVVAEELNNYRRGAGLLDDNSDYVWPVGHGPGSPYISCHVTVSQYGTDEVYVTASGLISGIMQGTYMPREHVLLDTTISPGKTFVPGLVLIAPKGKLGRDDFVEGLFTFGRGRHSLTLKLYRHDILDCHGDSFFR